MMISRPRYLLEVEQERPGPVDVGELGGEVGRIVLVRRDPTATAQDRITEIDLRIWKLVRQNAMRTIRSQFDEFWVGSRVFWYWL